MTGTKVRFNIFVPFNLINLIQFACNRIVTSTVTFAFVELCTNPRIRSLETRPLISICYVHDFSFKNYSDVLCIISFYDDSKMISLPGVINVVSNVSFNFFFHVKLCFIHFYINVCQSQELKDFIILYVLIICITTSQRVVVFYVSRYSNSFCQL